MGDRDLTIFIPSYNRIAALERCLDSVFDEIRRARNGGRIKVLVVDDYSSDPVEQVVAEHRRKGDEIDFFLHRKKCGIAEIAFFASLEFIHTPYAWLLGNDDAILPGSIDRLFAQLDLHRPGFILLNFIGREKNGSEYRYFESAEPAIAFPTGRDLFRNFGFATATTTFPCLCFRTDPIRSLDGAGFTGISPIYSHTFALLTAFAASKCLFIPEPAVAFSHNEAGEEMEKLEVRNYRYGRPALYHATLGLVRQLRHVEAGLGISVKDLARFREDELDKNSKQVYQTTTGDFVLGYSIAQLGLETQSMAGRSAPTIHFSRENMDEIAAFFRDADLVSQAVEFAVARGLFCDTSLDHEARAEALLQLRAAASSRALARVSRENAALGSAPQLGLPHGARKPLISSTINEKRSVG